MDQEISLLEEEIVELRTQLDDKIRQLNEKKLVARNLEKLSNDEISRFSRQIILKELRVSGQMKLKQASVLIVGAGGLGCPSAMYLVGAGIGRIGIVDYDDVEINNLHRQVLHRESSIGMSKVESIKNSLLLMNSSLKIETFKDQMNNENALDMISRYDVVLDCTDNVATRYLLNDACVMGKKPLVSGSAIQWEGQLTVYNYKDGPCYRCLFPVPPPPDTVMNCGDGGVVGAVTGVIGSLQALETIKIVLNLEDVLSGKLLLFDGISSKFRNVKLRPKKSDCEMCSETPKITKLVDYEFFCKMAATDKDRQLYILTPEERITVKSYKKVIDDQIPHLLIDVRSGTEFEICQLEKSINVDIKDLLNNKCFKENDLSPGLPIFVVCRRGNDSQLAVKHLKGEGRFTGEIKDIIGGLHAWAREIDPSFPVY